jgi:hypothetical protein
MLGFVIRENIKHYRRLLDTTTDERERARLHALLAEERQKERRLGNSARLRPESQGSARRSSHSAEWNEP